MYGKKKRKAKVSHTPDKKQHGSIRIIAGKLRGRKIPVVNSEGLRPTTDRTKEMLFNWLMQDVEGRVCLDLFAGSGSLAIEAMSRYAKKAVLIEKHKDVAKNLSLLVKTLELPEALVSVVNIDALKWLKYPVAEKFSLVFVDPPFHKNLIEPTVSGLVEMELLQNHALVYVEHEINLNWTAPESLLLVKQKDTPQVASRLFKFSPF